MRIYAVADIHGRAGRIRAVRENVGKLSPDVLVLAGDITTFVNSRHVISKFGNMPVPVLAIRGNWDTKKTEHMFGNRSLHLKTIFIDGIPFIGVGGAISLHFHSRLAIREERLIRKVESLLTKDSVLVVHPPPYGVLDRRSEGIHAGSAGLYDLIVRCQPFLVICGHIHESPGTALIGKTLVVNCSVGKKGTGAVISFEKGLTPLVRMMND